MKIKIKVSFFFVLILFLSSSFRVFPQEFSGKISTANNEEYFEKVLTKIKEAKQSVYLIMYISKYYDKYPKSPGNILLKELAEAKKRGAKVEVIFNRGIRKEDSSLTKENMNTGAFLAKNGVTVLFDSEKKTTHSKLLIIDEKYVVIGSTNWTYYALAFNNETAVIIESVPLAKDYVKYFEKVKKECIFLLKPSKISSK